jgi:S1-C subfamily serine protease
LRARRKASWSFFSAAAWIVALVVYWSIVTARPTPHANLVASAMLLLACISATALAQSATDAPQPVSAAVVSIGVIELEPTSEASASPSLAGRPASFNGSGFFVSKQGHVITALHVLRSAERSRDQMQGTDNRLIVGLRVGSSFAAVPAEVVGVDETHDLALLKAKPPAPVHNFVRLSSARPDEGALMEAAGLPAMMAMALVTNTGHMADKVLLQPGNRLLKAPTESDAAHLAPLREFYLADFKSEEGMSGGPVYLLDSGAVVGVVQGYTNDPRLAVVIPARNVIELLRSNNVACEELSAGKSD